MRQAAQLAAALVLAAAWAACPGKETPDAGGAPAHARVKIPLPDGWTARAAAEGVLMAGPPGRDVLRVEIRLGQGADLPSAEALARDFQGALPGVQSRVADTRSDEDSSILLFMLSRNSLDGGSRQEVVMLGAKRAGGDLFLCATVPGASEEEVKAASGACEELAYAAP